MDLYWYHNNFCCFIYAVLFCFFLMYRLYVKRLNELVVCMLHFGGLALALDVMASISQPLSLPRFLIGTAMVANTFPICDTLLSTIYSKVLGDGKKGVLFGFYSTFGSFARIVCPIWTGYVYNLLDEGYVFLILSVSMLVNMILYVVVLKRLRERVSHYDARNN